MTSSTIEGISFSHSALLKAGVHAEEFLSVEMPGGTQRTISHFNCELVLSRKGIIDIPKDLRKCIATNQVVVVWVFLR
jgi:hypothetical protein